MPSTSLTDYQVLHDTTFDLGGNVTTRELHWEVPDDIVLSDGGRKPILAFKILTFDKATLKVRVNNREVFQETFSESLTRGYWETFNFQTAFPEGASFDALHNPVHFFMSEGSARISDVVLWYQVNHPG